MVPSKVFKVFGEPIQVLVPGEATGGLSTTLIQTSPPGGGPPPHSHLREAETLFVLEGDSEFLDAGQWRRPDRGHAVSTQRGAVHTFRNIGATTGKMLIFVTPSGIERYFEEISPLSIPEDMAQLPRHLGALWHFVSPVCVSLDHAVGYPSFLRIILTSSSTSPATKRPCSDSFLPD